MLWSRLAGSEQRLHTQRNHITAQAGIPSTPHHSSRKYKTASVLVKSNLTDTSHFFRSIKREIFLPTFYSRYIYIAKHSLG